MTAILLHYLIFLPIVRQRMGDWRMNKSSQNGDIGVGVQIFQPSRESELASQLWQHESDRNICDRSHDDAVGLSRYR
ncbi:MULTISPECIES: hypothetical protein [Cyanophyceae]|uniref:hypothetical protein n=1 Tax=Cyanophyceae TaxID=3028117 RepID=UPI0018F04799|nr:hypothetical protein [Trichocoleus sp. FACHB-40]